MPGNSRATTYGRSKVFTRKGGEEHVFVPEKAVGILGDWNSALAANGAPGLDLNRCAYFFSQQGEAAASSFNKGFPTDALVSAESTALDTIAPFITSESLIPVAYVAGVGPDQTWNSIPAGRFSEMSTYALRLKENYDRSLDYGLGGALAISGYDKPPKDWLKTYTNAEFRIINRENYLDFIL